jgi:hypothetical protein
MSENKLQFLLGKTDEHIAEIFNFNVQAFADSQDFAWSEENIKKEIKSGWKLYSAKVEKEIVCVLFTKLEGQRLLTKNTPIKINFQGQGFSHLIKDFYEGIANENSVDEILNYCPNDNFRMISLNEGHAYDKTGNVLGPKKNILEWVKPWKK